MSESAGSPQKMSGILHRSQSDIDPFSAGVKKRGDAVRKAMESGSLDNIGEENGTTNHKGPVSPSPLRIFSQAKKKMNEIFVELDAQVKESTAFLKSTCDFFKEVPWVFALFGSTLGRVFALCRSQSSRLDRGSQHGGARGEAVQQN